MRNFYMLAAFLCLVSSVMSADDNLVVRRVDVASLPMVGESNISAMESRRVAFAIDRNPSFKIAKKANEDEAQAQVDYAYSRAASSIGSIGISAGGTFLNATAGMAGCYGDLQFYNLSGNAKNAVWTYADLDDVDSQGNWVTKTSVAQDLSIKGGVGALFPPVLDVTFASGKSAQYSLQPKMYFCGGNPVYWNIGNNGYDNKSKPFGLTFYQNSGMRAPDGQSGVLTYRNSYNAAPAENMKTYYNAGGVYVNPDDSYNWQAVMDSSVFKGKKVTDLALDNFMVVQPKPLGKYFFSQGWMWLQVVASAKTQLISYIYPIDEEGKIDDNPIAVGYAPIASGNTVLPVFDYYPLDENGEELEEDVFVDSAVAVTIEGFKGNSAISAIDAISGYYPFSYASYIDGNRDLVKAPSLYLAFSMKVDDNPEKIYAYDNALYHYNTLADKDGNPVDDDTATMLSYAQFVTDATYPFLFTMDGKNIINLPKSGGSTEVEIDALYYVCQESVEEGLYEIEASDWIDVSASPFDEKNPKSALTISVAGSEDRTGVVTVKSLGVSLELKVMQGIGSSVELIDRDSSEDMDGNVDYYDLAGRHVYKPSKGVYIRKSGNRTEKIIL